MATAIEIAHVRSRNRVTGWWVAGIVALVVLGGAVYSIWISNNPGTTPALPAAPPHAVALAQKSETDMLQGNFVLQTALFRTSDTPVKVITYYRTLLAGYSHQVGQFLEHSETTLPARAPEALQHMPPIFGSSGAPDPHTANYFYTEYSYGDSDVGIAVDARKPGGPTLVFMEMLTQPSS